jgi:hypothetical protein
MGSPQCPTCLYSRPGEEQIYPPMTTRDQIV